MTVDPLLQGLVKGFATEAQELCEKLTRDMLGLERASAGAGGLGKTYDNLCRGLHTLKGSAATVGLEELSELAHRMENLVVPMRKELAPLPADITDALLQALDVFMVRVRAHAEGKSDALEDPSEVFALLDKVSRPGAAAGSRVEKAPRKEKAERRKAERKEAAVQSPTSAVAEPSDRPATEQASQSAVGDDEGSWRVSTRQVTALMREVERLREVRLRLEERRRETEQGLAQLAQLGMLAETAESRALFMGVSRAISADGEEAADIVASLEEGLKAICTLPVRIILDPLQRAVRDLCRQTGKEAKLAVVGAEISLDRRVLEALKGPLVHLIRNAVDHGLERPEERERRGKHREGALVIRVEQPGNLLFVEVADDGNGIDTERVREEALRRGLVQPAELAAMDPSQLHQLIFRPGFSTSEEITATSGRGVGLDVVRSQVQTLQGQVEVQSVPGQGTRFILTLPAELGSSPVLVVRCGEHCLGVPMFSVEAIVTVHQAELRGNRSRAQIQYRDQLLPLQELGVMLGLRQPEAPSDGQSVMIVQSQGKRLAVAVDEILDDQDLVIRPLPREVREVPAYQGAATMARGELMLVLRPDWVVGQDGRAELSLGAVRRALVVDDSLTARALHRTVLEAGGFTVHTASSARQALDQLKRAAYDMIVCDIGMEEMDGVALTATLRASKETRALPVILVSALDSEEDRQKGLAAGADGFLSKKECASGRLLAEVASIMARRKEAS